MPCSGDKNAKAMTDEVCEQLASAFVIFITKGVWSSEQDMKTQFEKLVKKIIPKHNIFIHLEKKDFPDVKGHRKLNAPNIKRK
jgi:hypothetical protein